MNTRNSRNRSSRGGSHSSDNLEEVYQLGYDHGYNDASQDEDYDDDFSEYEDYFDDEYDDDYDDDDYDDEDYDDEDYDEDYDDDDEDYDDDDDEAEISKEIAREDLLPEAAEAVRVDVQVQVLDQAPVLAHVQVEEADLHHQEAEAVPQDEVLHL